MSDSFKQTTKQLSIKSGSLKRLAREVELYQKEHAEQKAIVSKLSATEGSDEWEIKNAQKVLKDCEQMILPSQDRVREAYADLQALVEATATDDSITASPEYQTAKKVMDEVEHTQSISLE